MIQPEEIQRALLKCFPDAEVSVQDLTGTRDHYQVNVLWGGFKGQSLMEQHKLVNKALADALEDGRIHALSIKTYAAV